MVHNITVNGGLRWGGHLSLCCISDSSIWSRFDLGVALMAWFHSETILYGGAWISVLSFKELWQSCGIFPNNTQHWLMPWCPCVWNLITVVHIFLNQNSCYNDHLHEHWFLSCLIAGILIADIMSIGFNLNSCHHIHVLWTLISVIISMWLNLDSCHQCRHAWHSALICSRHAT